MNTSMTPVAAAAGVTPVAGAGEVLALNREQLDAVQSAAVGLAQADASFEESMKVTAKAVAGILGTDPTFDHWTAVADRFQLEYKEERNCKPETAQKRWFAVAAAMEAEFALEKPAKPTKAAEVKAKQRNDAVAQAQALIQKAGATTPAAILALSAPAKGAAPLPAPVIKALAAQAGAAASDAAKDASEKAKARAKELRESIRKAVNGLTLAQLEVVRKTIDKLQAETLAAQAVESAAQPDDGDEQESDATEEETTEETADE